MVPYPTACIARENSVDHLINITFLLFIAASLIPMFQNKKAESVGPFTPDAELINGRAAMIGFAALLVSEAVNGAALF